MTLFQHWQESLRIFYPKQCMQVLKETLLVFVQAWKYFLRHFWYLLIPLVGLWLLRLQYEPVSREHLHTLIIILNLLGVVLYAIKFFYVYACCKIYKIRRNTQDTLGSIFSYMWPLFLLTFVSEFILRSITIVSPFVSAILISLFVPALLFFGFEKDGFSIKDIGNWIKHSFMFVLQNFIPLFVFGFVISFLLSLRIFLYRLGLPAWPFELLVQMIRTTIWLAFYAFLFYRQKSQQEIEQVAYFSEWMA